MSGLVNIGVTCLALNLVIELLLPRGDVTPHAKTFEIPLKKFGTEDIFEFL